MAAPQDLLFKCLLAGLAYLLVGVPGAAAVRAAGSTSDGLFTDARLPFMAQTASLVQLAPVPALNFWGPLTWGLSLVTTIAVVVALYWSRSWGEILSIVVYLIALSTVRLSVKAVFVEYDFDFPLAVSAIHFFFCAVVAFSVLAFRLGKSKPVALPVPSGREFCCTILPIALSFAFCIGVGNKVLVLCSTALTEILMATQPMMSIPMVLALGMPFDSRLLIPTLLVILSCMLCSYGDVHFSKLGLFLAVLSNLLRALKAALQQKMLTGSQRDRFDPCALLAWMSVPSAILMVGWSAVAEGREPWARLLSDHQTRPMLVASLLFSSVAACVLNLSQLFVVGGLGAVGSQIVGQLKIVLTILGSVTLLSERVTRVQCLGFVGVLGGIFLYSRMEQEIKRAAEQKQLEEQKMANAS